MMSGLHNVADVVSRELCNGCGTCAGVCPNEAISMHVSNGLLIPEINEDKCSRCRICVQCCPGHSVDFEKLNLGIFGKQPEDKLLGNYLRCYVGHASDNLVRHQTSSGGVATKLLAFALESGIIDGALVVRMKKDRPLETQPFIARTEEEILSASKSKYCPVSMNQALNQILKENGRFAVVGLPCQIHGIRKAEEIHRVLKKRIVLRIGLLCSRTANFSATEFLLKRTGIDRGQVVELSYRGNGWPGSMSIRLKDGSNSSIPCVAWNGYWPVFASFLFTPLRCIMCPDHTNELADISLGDAWLPELKGKRLGESIIMTRTKTGEDFLKQASITGAMNVKPVGPEKVRQSQAEPLKFKKKDLGTRLAILSSIGTAVPIFNPGRSVSPSLVAFLRTFYAYFNVKASSNRQFDPLLLHVPFPIFRLYYGIRKFLSLV